MVEPAKAYLWKGVPLENLKHDKLLEAALHLAEEVWALQRRRVCPTCEILCPHRKDE